MNSKARQTDTCINLSYRKAARVISQIYDRELSACGIKCTQFSILRAIHLLKRTTNAELQHHLALNQTTLTRGLRPLIRDGLIEANPGTDRRQKFLTLTPAGEELHRRAGQQWLKAQQHVRERLGQNMTDQMIELNAALVALRN
jgi:DNA-binding MarR family transcriptional regulator